MKLQDFTFCNSAILPSCNFALGGAPDASEVYSVACPQPRSFPSPSEPPHA